MSACGNNDTLSLFCHHSLLSCIDEGKHASGVELTCSGSLCDNITSGQVGNFREFGMAVQTTKIPWTVFPALHLEADPEGLRHAPGDENEIAAVWGAPSTACKFCDPGKYSVRVRSDYLHKDIIERPPDSPGTVNVCLPCPGGRKCLRGEGCDWHKSPSDCPTKCSAGHYSLGNASSCERCERNKYQDEEGSPSCKNCPTGFTFGFGAASIDSCICPVGTRRVAIGQFECVQCAAGQNCEWDGGQYFDPISRSDEYWADDVNTATNFQTQPYTLQGYWTDPENPATSTSVMQSKCTRIVWVVSLGIITGT